jgi:myristoylated alanine-rich C-kinase substrate protein
LNLSCPAQALAGGAFASSYAGFVAVMGVVVFAAVPVAIPCGAMWPCQAPIDKQGRLNAISVILVVGLIGVPCVVLGVVLFMVLTGRWGDLERHATGSRDARFDGRITAALFCSSWGVLAAAYYLRRVAGHCRALLAAAPPPAAPPAGLLEAGARDAGDARGDAADAAECAALRKRLAASEADAARLRDEACALRADLATARRAFELQAHHFTLAPNDKRRASLAVGAAPPDVLGWAAEDGGDDSAAAAGGDDAAAAAGDEAGGGGAEAGGDDEVGGGGAAAEAAEAGGGDAAAEAAPDVYELHDVEGLSGDEAAEDPHGPGLVVALEEAGLVVAPEAADVDTPDDGDAPRPIDETLAGDGAPYGYTLCGLAA